MENIENTKDNEYLSQFIDKYDFIEAIIITDLDGSLMISAFQKDTQISKEDKKNLRGMLSSSLNISLDQISKTVKWNTNSITLMYNKHVVYQKKLNNVTFCHIICKEDDYNHVIVHNIGNNLKGKFEPLEKKLIEIKNENDKEND